MAVTSLRAGPFCGLAGQAPEQRDWVKIQSAKSSKVGQDSTGVDNSDAADGNRSATGLDRAAQTARKLSRIRTDKPQATDLPRPSRRRTRSELSGGGTASMPVREKGQERRFAAGTSLPHVPSLTQTAAKLRGFSPTAPGFTAETDSPLEGEGFEPSVPLSRHPSAQCSGARCCGVGLCFL